MFAHDFLDEEAKSQLKVIENALETAAMMLGENKARGYCLEMICADFLAGANLQDATPEVLLASVSQLYGFLPQTERRRFPEETRKAS